MSLRLDPRQTLAPAADDASEHLANDRPDAATGLRRRPTRSHFRLNMRRLSRSASLKLRLASGLSSVYPMRKPRPQSMRERTRVGRPNARCRRMNKACLGRMTKHA